MNIARLGSLGYDACARTFPAVILLSFYEGGGEEETQFSSSLGKSNYSANVHNLNSCFSDTVPPKVSGYKHEVNEEEEYIQVKQKLALGRWHLRKRTFRQVQ